MFRRIWRAISLDAKLYHEVAKDKRYNGQAFLVVTAAAMFTAAGPFLNQANSLLLFIALIVNSLVFAWALWSAIAYLAGSLLGGQATMDQMLRSMAFANAPHFLLLLGIIPFLVIPCMLGAWLLSLAAAVIAIRETMGFSTERAVIAGAVGLAAYALSSALISTLLGGSAGILRLLGGS